MYTRSGTASVPSSQSGALSAAWEEVVSVNDESEKKKEKKKRKEEK